MGEKLAHARNVALGESVRLKEFDSVGSTNVLVKEALRAGEPEGLVVSAFQQTAGYGRQGRAWVSPYGGLYMSLLLRPHVPSEHLSTIALVVALAVREALVNTIESLTSHDARELIRVKWPNDVVCAQGKLCGISTEAIQGALCVGIGINVFVPAGEMAVGGKNAPAYLSAFFGDGGWRADAPARTFDRANERQADDTARSLDGADVQQADRGARGFEGTVHHVAYGEARHVGAAGLTEAERATLEQVRDRVIASFFKRYEQWIAQGFASFAQEFRDCSSLVGSAVDIVSRTGGNLASGVVVGVDDEGRLLLRDDGGALCAISSGEAHIRAVSFQRP